MKKILLAASAALLSVFAADAQSLYNQSQAGFRLEVLGGIGTLTGKEAPGQDINRVTFHTSVAPSVVLNNNRNAIGLLFIYRYNNLMDGYYEYLDNDVNVDWHTMFLGPQYTFVSAPYSNSSFLLDIGLGGVFFSEKTSVGGYDYGDVSLNGFGMNVGIGGRFRVGQQTFFIMKLSILSSTLDPGWAYDEDLNVSSVNLSLGVSFGK